MATDQRGFFFIFFLSRGGIVFCSKIALTKCEKKLNLLSKCFDQKSKLWKKNCKIISSNTFFGIKFLYSEKATKFCKTSALLLSHVVPVKSKVEISQNCVAFSEYMNFKVEFSVATKSAKMAGKWQENSIIVPKKY